MSKLYLATRLYNINDRLTSLSLCNTINGWIDTGILTDLEHCFLPYRDSNGKIPPNPPDLGEAIFNLDVENVRNSAGIACYMDGPHYDSGMGFETGFAHSLGLPLFLMTTDYFKQSINDSTEYYSISKLAEYISTVLIHITQNSTEINDYEFACLDIRAQTLKLLQQALVENINQPITPLTKSPSEYTYYIDPNFKYTEGGNTILEAITTALEGSGKTYYEGNNQGDIATELENFLKCDNVILFADVFDFDIDSTILQGIAYGVGIESILYSSSSKRYQNGDFVFTKNPMNYYSAKSIVHTTQDLITLITT